MNNKIEEMFFSCVENCLKSIPELKLLLQRSKIQGNFNRKRFIYEYSLNDSEAFTNFKYNSTISQEFFFPQNPNGFLFLIFKDIQPQLELILLDLKYEYEEEVERINESSENISVIKKIKKDHEDKVKKLESWIKEPNNKTIIEFYKFLFKEILTNNYFEPLLLEYHDIFSKVEVQLVGKGSILSHDNLESKQFQVSFKLNDNNSPIYKDLFSKIPLIESENGLSISTFAKNTNNLNTMTKASGQSFQIIRYYNLLYGCDPKSTDSILIRDDFDNKSENKNNDTKELICKDYSLINFKQVTYFADSHKKFNSYTIIPNTFLFEQIRIRTKMIKDLIFLFKQEIKKNNAKAKKKEYSLIYNNFFSENFELKLGTEKKRSKRTIEENLSNEMKVKYENLLENEIKTLFLKKQFSEKEFIGMFAKNVEANTILKHSSQNIDFRVNRGNILLSQVPSFGAKSFEKETSYFIDSIESNDQEELEIIKFFIVYLNRFHFKFKEESFNLLTKTFKNVNNNEGVNIYDKNAVRKISKSLAYIFKKFYNTICKPYIEFEEDLKFENYSFQIDNYLWDFVTEYKGEKIDLENLYLKRNSFNINFNEMIKKGIHYE